MLDWVEQCQQIQQRGQALVLVTVASVQGSSPREAGARMLVMEDKTLQTIGGGNLEFQCIDIARGLLVQETNTPFHKRFSLAAGLGQCCGGVVTVLFEKVSSEAQWPGVLQAMRQCGEEVMQVVTLGAGSSMPRLLVSESRVFPPQMEAEQPEWVDLARKRLLLKAPSKTETLRLETEEGPQALLFDRVADEVFNLFLFGAGHVGQALVALLDQQPCRVTWVDTRDDQLPLVDAPNIRSICTDTPEDVVSEAEPGSYFLVMTHDHWLDQRLAEQILRRNEFAWFGMIGSRSKRAKFHHRLRARGIPETTLLKMVCPIGIAGIDSKAPSAIAVSVMAQLLQAWELLAQRQHPHSFSQPACGSVT